MTNGPLAVIVRLLDSAASPANVAAVTSRLPFPAILESLHATPVAGRYSIFAANPLRTLVVHAGEPVPFDRLKSLLDTTGGTSPIPNDFPYAGGWIGFISYEAGAGSTPETLQTIDCNVPSVRFGLYDHLLVFDHAETQWWGVAVLWSERGARASAENRMHALQDRLEQAAVLELISVPIPKAAKIEEYLSREQYALRVERIKHHIRSGVIYQANLAQRFRVRTDSAPFEIYRRIRECNPAAYCAFLAWDDAAIVSASPELFLDLRGGKVTTRPIKGTRPRTGDAHRDCMHRVELESSAKEHSELNMIIDLLRNDLGRVCAYGSVQVTDTGSIEEHPTVFHRVATIEGRLADGRNWFDLLEASFPPGSIVGAPKIRAMQVIAEAEPFSRGTYCGAIGWIGLDGQMTLSVAIRTMTIQKGVVDVFAGGGIVAESNSDAEYQEIMAKAAGLLSGLNASPSPTRINWAQEALVP
jgi:para-aminobenzoate synthetase component 1